MISIGVWSAVVQPGEPLIVDPQADIRITNVALGDVLADESGRTTLKMNYVPPGANSDDSDDEEETEKEDDSKKKSKITTTIVCSLTPGKNESATTDIIILEQEEYLFELTGKNPIYLTGNFVDQTPNSSFNDFSDSDMDSEEGYDLQDVSSDVEINPEDLEDDSDASRFEEIVENTPAKSLKRPRDSDAMVVGGDAKPSKAEKNKNKKLKAANGDAVAAGSADKEKDKEETAEKKDKKKDKKKDDKPAATTKELPSGVKIIDAKTGSGPTAKRGNTVQMRYIGKLENGKTFDSNTKGAPFTFRLGAGEVIKGWDEGIPGMQVGGERTLIIPPAMAYGKKKTSGIPPNSVLKFEVKLVSIR